MLAFVIGLIAGIASPTQASVNARIREDYKSPYITTIVNFIVAGSLLVLLILVVERNLSIPLGIIAKEPAWIWLGGAFGTAIVILNIICLPKLGSANNVMLICFGQIMTGLVIDHFGLFRAPQASMSLMRFIGAVLVILGIALVNGKLRKTDEREAAEQVSQTQISRNRSTRNNGTILLYIVLAIFCGAACAGQVAVNGTLKGMAGSALKATLISMAVGLITSLLVTLAVALIRGKAGLYDDGCSPDNARFKTWMVGGGALAIVIVGGNAVAAPILGTGVVTILNLIGMMAGGLVIDAVGFLGIDKKPVTLTKIIGMLLMTAGTAIISLL